MIAALLVGVLTCLGDPSPRQPEGSPLAIADLASYRQALASQSHEAPLRVGFRDLWDKQAQHLGRRVEIEGQVELQFEQGAVGEFPALWETWAFDTKGNPFCLVNPKPRRGGLLERGSRVRFVGVYLKLVEYRSQGGTGDGGGGGGGGGTVRLAPLIVGSAPPVLISRDLAGFGMGRVWQRFSLVFAILIGLFVLATLYRRHTEAPRRRSRDDPPPGFIS